MFNDSSILSHGSEVSVFSDENEYVEYLNIIKEPFPKQIAFGALYASDGYMKHALYIYKCV
jgi:hypothetical protein